MKMFTAIRPKVLSLQIVALFACLPDLSDTLIITSVLAGDKKFKTISFDHKWLKPLTFEKEMPNTEFRRHRTLRPPKFDIDVNIPIKLPLEDEYPQDEYKKPVTSDIFFQTGEIHEPNHSRQQHKGQKYGSSEQYAASSSDLDSQMVKPNQGIDLSMKDGLKGLLPALAKSIKIEPQFITESHLSARSDVPRPSLQQPQALQMAQPMARESSASQMLDRNYAPPPVQYQSANANYHNQEPEFVPGGFVNLQLSGPTGGPKMTYEDVDKEHWARQLSQTAGAMPSPILNYQQLQNFYGGLGTFTNGLAEHRYVESGLLDALKTKLNHFTNKFHLG